MLRQVFNFQSFIMNLGSLLFIWRNLQTYAYLLEGNLYLNNHFGTIAAAIYIKNSVSIATLKIKPSQYSVKASLYGVNDQSLTLLETVNQYSDVFTKFDISILKMAYKILTYNWSQYDVSNI